ncbi:hypothetical protein PINS_up021813 [Pythium insidiosum]|nr:hypothetical protein PINS_up021813 [Pythium insidiosum]
MSDSETDALLVGMRRALQRRDIDEARALFLRLPDVEREAPRWLEVALRDAYAAGLLDIAAVLSFLEGLPSWEWTLEGCCVLPPREHDAAAVCAAAHRAADRADDAAGLLPAQARVAPRRQRQAPRRELLLTTPSSAATSLGCCGAACSPGGACMTPSASLGTGSSSPLEHPTRRDLFALYNPYQKEYLYSPSEVYDTQRRYVFTREHLGKDTTWLQQRRWCITPSELSPVERGIEAFFLQQYPVAVDEFTNALEQLPDPTEHVKCYVYRMAANLRMGQVARRRAGRL